jgi:hypothetical protein
MSGALSVILSPSEELSGKKRKAPSGDEEEDEDEEGGGAGKGDSVQSTKWSKSKVKTVSEGLDVIQGAISVQDEVRLFLPRGKPLNLSADMWGGVVLRPPASNPKPQTLNPKP